MATGDEEEAMLLALAKSVYDVAFSRTEAEAVEEIYCQIGDALTIKRAETCSRCAATPHDCPLHSGVAPTSIAALTVERDSLRGEVKKEQDYAAHWKNACDIAAKGIEGLRAELMATRSTLNGMTGERDAEREISQGWESKYEDVELSLSAERAHIGELEAGAAAMRRELEHLQCVTDGVTDIGWDGLNRMRVGICEALQSNAGAALLARLQAAEAVCEAIDGRHPIAAGDRVGVLLKAWRESK